MRKILNTISKHFSRKGMYPFYEKHLDNIPEGAAVLSIGSGGAIGDMCLAYEKKNGFRLTQMDIDASKNPDVLGDVCHYEFEEESYDCIVLAEVIEHTKQPFLATENIYRALKSGGNLLMSAPFTFPVHDYPHDYFRFTKEGFKLLVAKFKKYEITNRNTWPEALMVLFVRIYKGCDKCKILGVFYLFLGLTLFPIFWISSKISDEEFLTTGYLIHATK